MIFSGGLHRKHAVQNLNRHQAVGGMLRQRAAGFKSEHNLRHRRAMKNRLLAMAALRVVRLGAQFLQRRVQVENVTFAGKTLGGMLAQPLFIAHFSVPVATDF